MRFFHAVFAAAALVSAAAAKPEIHKFPPKIEPGKTYEITYVPADDTPTTFILRQGADTELETLETLTTTATGGKFSWTVSRDLPNRDDYALEIQQGSATNNNYIGPIVMSGSTATSDAPTASSTSAEPTVTVTSSKTIITTASHTFSTSVGLNSTVTSATLSPTSARTSSSSSTTSGAGVPQQTGAASTLGSPLALVLSGLAAMVYFN